MDEIRLPWPAWKIERLIGQGPFGKVYEISRMNPFGIEERSALKIVRVPKNDNEIISMREEGFQEESIKQYNQGILDNVLRTYSALMQLKGQRGIVRYDDFESVPHENDIGWDVYIRMELLTPLTSVMMERTLSENEIRHLGEDLCRALIVCEEKGIIHCDIKPENILLNQYGDFKLGDFGIARTMVSTYDGRRYQTDNFTAPEVYHKLEYGPAADMYSLGMVMHFLLNNYRRPFAPMDNPTSYQELIDANMRRLLRKEPVPDPVHGNEKLKHAVRKACAYEPENRFQTAAEFLEAIQFSANDVEQKSVEKHDEDLRCQVCGSRISEQEDYCMVCGAKIMNRNKTGRNGSLDEYGEVSYDVVYASPGGETLFPDNKKRYPFNFAEKKRERTIRKKSIDSGPFDLFRRKK